MPDGWYVIVYFGYEYPFDATAGPKQTVESCPLQGRVVLLRILDALFGVAGPGPGDDVRVRRCPPPPDYSTRWSARPAP